MDALFRLISLLALLFCLALFLSNNISAHAVNQSNDMDKRIEKLEKELKQTKDFLKFLIQQEADNKRKKQQNRHKHLRKNKELSA